MKLEDYRLLSDLEKLELVRELESCTFPETLLCGSREWYLLSFFRLVVDEILDKSKN